MTQSVWAAVLSVACVAAEPQPVSSTLSEGKAPAEKPLNEEAPVGPNQQPAWTAHRRFPTTRVYVLPPWQVEFESWWRGKFPRAGRANHLFQEEVGVGLPWRFQVDFYENFESLAGKSFRRQGEQAELRWAFAEWGKLPLNPTIYAEWKFNDHAADVYEIKLLFGEEIAPRWHWGLNLIHEQEDSGAKTTEFGFSQALSYTVLDEKLSVGLEMKFAHVTEDGKRHDASIEFLLGPSLQWRPTKRTHLDLVPLFGLTSESQRVDAFVVFGVDFGPGGESQKPRAPISTRSQ